MSQWDELVQIASSIQYEDEEDAIIWQFNSSGCYYVQSLYAIVNNRGVRQVFTPAIWNFTIPPRVHIFLWLLANNKTLTRGNLAKRRKVAGETCLFCAEKEIVTHVFFECCVARAFWEWVNEFSGRPVGVDFELVATC
jgi:hypothetical protein